MCPHLFKTLRYKKHFYSHLVQTIICGWILQVLVLFMVTLLWCPTLQQTYNRDRTRHNTDVRGHPKNRVHQITHGKGRGSINVSRIIFCPFLNNNFLFWAVYSLIKACILQNEKCHVTWGEGGGRQSHQMTHDTWGRGVKYAKKVSRDIWMAPNSTKLILQ